MNIEEDVLHKALKLEPNSVYVLRVKRELSAEMVSSIKDALKPYSDKFGIEFIVMSRDIEICRETLAD